MSDKAQGSLAEGWTRVQFGDVVRNKNLTTKDPKKDCLDRIVGLTHLDSESLPIARWDILEGETSFSRTFAAGDVLFGKRRAYQRKVGVPDFSGICSGDILVFESKGPALLQGYLPYIVQSDAFFERALGTSAGSLSPRTNWGELARFEFALPPLEEQKRIIEVMESAEQTRACYRAVSLAGSRLRAALLNRLDSEGTRVPLGSVASIQRGSSYKSEDYTAKGNGKPFLTLKSVSRAGHYAPDGLKWVRDDFDPSRSAEPGDLFFANTDLTPGKLLIGAPFFFPGEELDAAPAFSMDLSKVEVINSSVSAEFLYFALSTPRIRQEMRLLSGGSTVAHLRLTSVPQIEISVPTPSRQKELLVQLRGIDRAMTAAFGAEQAVSRLSRRAFDVLGGGQSVV